MLELLENFLRLIKELFIVELLVTLLFIVLLISVGQYYTIIRKKLMSLSL